MTKACPVPDDAKVIKIATAALGAKRLFEGQHHTGHAIPVPDGTKDTVAKPTEAWKKKMERKGKIEKVRESEKEEEMNDMKQAVLREKFCKLESPYYAIDHRCSRQGNEENEPGGMRSWQIAVPL